MVNTFLDEFVRDALNRGETQERIRAELTSAGWPSNEVDAALAAWAVASFGLAVPKPRIYVSAREAFLYIVMFNLLGLVSYNLGSLLFSLIDNAIADALDQTSRAYQEQGIRNALAALAVATPLLGGFGWYIASLRRTNIEMEQSRVRKWLTYITLMMAALVLVGDLIALVYNFLSGELSQRLLLKLVAVGAIAGGILGFFVADVEHAKAPRKFSLVPLLPWTGAATVVAASFAGYLSIQDPITVRELRLDNARLVALKRIAISAQCAYSFTGRIPASYKEIRLDFEERRIAIQGSDCNAVKFSTEDEALATYQASGEAHIRICSSFLHKSEAISADLAYDGPPYYSSSFPELEEKRPAGGRHCFTIRIVKLPSPTVPPSPPPPVKVQ